MHECRHRRGPSRARRPSPAARVVPRPPHLDHDLDLVVLLNELLRAPQADLVVVHVRVGPELELLHVCAEGGRHGSLERAHMVALAHPWPPPARSLTHDARLLLLLRVLIRLLLLELELGPLHQPAHGWRRVGRHQHQVHLRLHRHLQRLACRHDAQRLLLLPNHAHLRKADLLVHQVPRAPAVTREESVAAQGL